MLVDVELTKEDFPDETEGGMWLQSILPTWRFY